MQRFELTEDHITLLQEANIRWTDAEYGAPQIDSKRPFGNSSVERDLCEILAEPDATVDGEDVYSDETIEEMREIYYGLDTALQIVLNYKTFEPGVFEREKSWYDWERVK